MRKKVILSVNWNIVPIFLSLLFIVSCSSSRLSVLPDKPATEYPYYQEVNGLRISIDPYCDSKRVKDFFSFDFLSINKLPVLVKIENNTRDTTYFIDSKNGIKSYSDPELTKEVKRDFDQIQAATISLDKAYQKSLPALTAARTYYQGQGYYPVTLWGDVIYTALGIPLIIAQVSEYAKSSGIEYNLTKNTLMEKTLYPGMANMGFVFCDVSNIRGDFILVIEAIDYKNKKTKLFYFPVVRTSTTE